MDASTVRRFVPQLEQAGIPVWLDGGWGIDALLGRETRPHHDLDLIVRVSDVLKVLDVLQPAGFVFIANRMKRRDHQVELTLGADRTVTT